MFIQRAAYTQLLPMRTVLKHMIITGNVEITRVATWHENVWDGRPVSCLQVPYFRFPDTARRLARWLDFGRARSEFRR